MTTKFDNEASNAFLRQRANDSIVKYIQEYSVVHYVGDVNGKSVLDMGCGFGQYTRMMKRLGASRVLGVDVSQSMIDLAVDEEEKNPLGIEYRTGDARTLEIWGQFDVVLVNGVLIYMETIEDLQKFVRTVCNNLKPGGKVIGYQPRGFSDYWNEILDKYGRKMVKVQDIPNGHIANLFCDNVPEPLEVSLHFFDLSIYKKIFKNVGFQHFESRNIIISEEGYKNFPKDFWNDFLQNPYLHILEAIK